MDNTAFATGIPMATGPKYDEEQDKRQRVLDGLQNKSSSPDGAASQEGALGASASAGDGSTALGEVGKGEGGTGMDMVSIFMGASEKERSNLTQKTQEAMAPSGKSLEGGFLDILKQGGPQAMARAAQFGINMEPWAAKLNPDQSGIALGQAMGNIPSDKQAGSNEAFKTTGKALSDNRAATKKSNEETAAKKKDQLNAIAAFMTETGLRLLASNRPTAQAFGEAALGTMDASAKRKRLAANDKMQAAELKRQHGREDTKDTMAAQKNVRDEAKAKQDSLEKITLADGTVEFVKVVKGQAMREDGTPVIVSDPSQLSATARRGATDAAANASTRYRKVIRDLLKDKYEAKNAEQGIRDISAMPEGPDREKAIEDWIRAKVKADGYFAAQDPEEEITDYRDY